MTNIVNRDCDIPDGFVEEEIEGQLSFEDIGENSELWLIRVPIEVELSALDKKRIYLNCNSNSTSIKNLKTEDGKILECFAENCDIPNLCVVLPEKNGKKLRAVNKVFKGSILISEGLNLNDDTEVKHEVDVQGEATIDTPNSTHDSKRKKSKTKKGSLCNLGNFDLNYETEDADNLIIPVTKCKRSKKRSDVNKNGTVESMEVKSEPEQIDLDEFPHCKSQN